MHLRAVAGGWRVRKCHFRALKHLRAVKIFPLARVPELGEARLDVGLLDRTPLPLVMSALVIEKGRALRVLLIEYNEHFICSIFFMLDCAYFHIYFVIVLLI